VQKQFYKKFYEIKLNLTYRNIRKPRSQILVFFYFTNIWFKINAFSVAGKWKYLCSNPTKTSPNPANTTADIHSFTN